MFSLLHKEGRLTGQIQNVEKFEVISLKDLNDQEIEKENSEFQKLSNEFTKAFERLQK